MGECDGRVELGSDAKAVAVSCGAALEVGDIALYMFLQLSTALSDDAWQ